jgi:hypothetical protein
MSEGFTHVFRLKGKKPMVAIISEMMNAPRTCYISVIAWPAAAWTVHMKERMRVGTVINAALSRARMTAPNGKRRVSRLQC